MKLVLQMAGICAFVVGSASAGGSETHPTLATMDPALSRQADATVARTAPAGEVWQVKGATEGCLATVGPGNGPKCGDKGGGVNFPVMIGVYR